MKISSVSGTKRPRTLKPSTRSGMFDDSSADQSFDSHHVISCRDQIRRIVRLPDVIALEYKVHMDSVNDKSSYRNPNMVFRANTKPPGERYGGYRERQAGDQAGGYHHRASTGWKGNNPRWNGNNNNNNEESGGEGHQPRRERTDGSQRERGENEHTSGWRRNRSDGDQAVGNSDNSRYERGERGEYRGDRPNFRERDQTRPTANVNSSASSGQSAPIKPPTQSSTYSSGGGSFASRLKGAGEGGAPAESEGQLKSPTGENWTKVKNPFKL